VVTDVLAINPPLVLANDFIDYPYFTGLGLLQAAAQLRAEGHSVRVVDALALPTSGLVRDDAAHVRLGVPLATFLDALPLSSARPGVVVVCNSPWLRAKRASMEIGRLVAALKRRFDGVPCVLADCDVGGMHVIAWEPAEAVVLGFDATQRFEAEGVLGPLCERLGARRELPDDARHVASAPLTVSLGELPEPAWDLIDVEAFSRFMGRVARSRHKAEIFDCTPPVLPVKTSRGCTYRCNFCTSNAWSRVGLDGPGYRAYPKAWIEAHLRGLRDRYGVRRVVVLDAMVNVSTAHFDAVLDVLEGLDMAADFPNGMRADRLTEAQVMRMPGRVPVLSVSAESAVERVVNGAIGKRIDPESISRVAAWCREAGQPLVVHWMIGQPAETRREILRTLEVAWDLWERFGARPLVQFATPIKGTALWDEVERAGLWAPGEVGEVARQGSDIGPLFQGKPAIVGPDWTGYELGMAKRVFETKLEASVPKKVIMNTTYVCNNQCVFCATGNRMDRHGPIEEQIAFLEQRHAQGFRLVDFDGGEPTTNPNLMTLLKKAKSLGFEQINLTTNGRLMSSVRNAEVIVRSGITNLLVSLHGPTQDVHEAQTQAPGSFAQTVGGIRNALPLAQKHGVGFGVNITLTKGNWPHLMVFGELLASIGVPQVNIQFLTPFGRASAEHQPDPDDVAPLLHEFIEKYANAMQVQVINLPLCYLGDHAAHGLGDLYKMERQMLFVTMDDVDLFEYLGSRRRKEKPCETCLYSTACAGFYYFPDEWNDEARARWGD